MHSWMIFARICNLKVVPRGRIGLVIPAKSALTGLVSQFAAAAKVRFPPSLTDAPLSVLAAALGCGGASRGVTQALSGAHAVRSGPPVQVRP